MNWIECFRNYQRVYRTHALEWMVARNINFTDLDHAFDNLEVIETYPDDSPYSSCLAIGYTKKRKPIHIVFSINETEKHVYIITVYEPDPEKWEIGFRRRKE